MQQATRWATPNSLKDKKRLEKYATFNSEMGLNTQVQIALTPVWLSCKATLATGIKYGSFSGKNEIISVEITKPGRSNSFL